MKHIAKIQGEFLFLKKARKWDDLTLEEQRRYLKRHPKSKRRLTAKPAVQQYKELRKYRGVSKVFEDFPNGVIIDGYDDWFAPRLSHPDQIAKDAGVELLAEFHSGHSGISSSGIVIDKNDLQKFKESYERLKKDEDWTNRSTPQIPEPEQPRRYGLNIKFDPQNPHEQDEDVDFVSRGWHKPKEEKETKAESTKEKKTRKKIPKGLPEDVVSGLERLRISDADGYDEVEVTKDKKGNIEVVTTGFRYLGNWIEREEDDDFAEWSEDSYQHYADKFEDWAKNKSWYDPETMKTEVYPGEKKWAYFGIRYRDPRKAKAQRKHLKAVVKNSLAEKNGKPQPVSDEKMEKLTKRVKKHTSSYYVTGTQFLKQKRDGTWKIDRKKLNAQLDKF